MNKSTLALSLLVALCFGTAMGFEEDQRVTSLTMQFGTDTFAAQNAFGGALVGSILRQQLQSALDSSVANGGTSLMYEMLGLTDFTGTNQASFKVGVVNGIPVLDPNNPTQYSGTSDLDWWYQSVGTEIQPNGAPLNQLNAQIVSKVLTAGPGQISFASVIPGTPAFVMSSTNIKASVGNTSKPLISSNGFAPGHLPSENIDPALVTFASMTTGQLKGNISAASLAAVPIPAPIAADANSGYSANNTLLDLIVGGYSVIIFVPIPQVKPTQPDAVDPGVTAPGAGGPYTFQTNASKMVIGCKDKNGAAVNLDDGLKAAAYSSYFTFTSDRVFVLPPAPEIVVNQPLGTNIPDGGTKSFGNVTAGTTASLSFTILNTGNADLTGLGITIDGPDSALFTLTVLPFAPVPGPGFATFTVQFSPTALGAASAVLHIASNDANENPFDINLAGTGVPPNAAPTDMALSSSAIPENQPAGTAVGTFTTTDPDQGNTFTYTLVSGAGSTDNASFTISGDTLKSAAPFDFETKSSYTIRVRSTDQGALFFEKSFTITVTDVDETAPVFTSPPAANPSPGFVNQPITFSTAVSPPTPVTITWNFGDGTSQTGASVTHAYAASGNFTVMVTAAGGGSATQSFSLSVLSVSNFHTDKAGLKFNFSKHQDSFTLSGLVQLSANFSPAAKTISVMIGGYSTTQIFNSKNKTTDTSNRS